MLRQSDNFPDHIKSIRQQLGLSQDELAHALGVSFVTVNRWENGKTMPSKLAQISFENYCLRMVEQGKLKHDPI
jgi:DNA-binding transcriptional regulator YiaG